MTSVELGLTEADVTKAEVDAVVIAIAKGADGPELVTGSEEVDAAFDGGLAELLGVLGAAGKADEVTKLPTRGALTAPLLVATGVGAIADGGPDAEQVRRAAGAAARALAGTASALSTLSRVDLRAAAEGTAMGAYSFVEYRSKAGDPPLQRMDFAVAGISAETERELNRARLVGEAVRNARNLVNTPPNDLFPASFADRAKALGEAAGLTVEVLDEAALADGGYGGVLGVGGGSSRPPRLVQLRHSPAGATKKVAIVGKGVTFDTGGISIKPAANMDQMTSDMAGAAGVIATVVLAAKLELPIEVIATVPMVENMPSGTAYRPGDVLTMYGGKTVEVLNTDAEGRLILADALVRAAEDEPDYLIDTATLTGAQMVALGSRTPGVMGTPEFRDRVAELSQSAGEGAWPMPLPEHLRADLDSRLADIANVAGHRWGGMLSAALFLKEFVADEQQWIHLDIAGPAFNTGSPWGYNGKGATGVPVRTLIAVLEDVAANG